MKLLNGNIQYNNGTDYVDVTNILSGDITKTATPSRSNWDRRGAAVNETISSVNINFIRGYNELLDNAQRGDIINLKLTDGAIIYTADFEVSEKYNTLVKETQSEVERYTNTYISFILPDTSYVAMSTASGSGGDVTKAYVDEQDQLIESNKVTTDSDQEISGKKNFTGGLTVSSNNVLTSSDAYTKSQIDALPDQTTIIVKDGKWVCNIPSGKTYKGVVATVGDLPTTATDGDIYFVGATGATMYDEYIWIDSLTTTTKWAKIGTTSIDISSKLDATKCTYQTTAPTAAATDNGVHIVYLADEPETKYDGYIYLIAE